MTFSLAGNESRPYFGKRGVKGSGTFPSVELSLCRVFCVVCGNKYGKCKVSAALGEKIRYFDRTFTSDIAVAKLIPLCRMDEFLCSDFTSYKTETRNSSRPMALVSMQGEIKYPAS